MKRKMYGLVISMAAALIMTGCGQTPAVQEKSGAESADAFGGFQNSYIRSLIR